jgi:hypothetical protein
MLQLARVKRNDREGTVDLRSGEECSFQLAQPSGEEVDHDYFKVLSFFLEHLIEFH